MCNRVKEAIALFNMQFLYQLKLYNRLDIMKSKCMFQDLITNNLSLFKEIL